MPVGSPVVPVRPRRDTDLTPEVDDAVRSLLGDSYPDLVFVIYLPQRVCHAFLVGDTDDQPGQGRFHWMLAFTSPEIAQQWAVNAARVRRIGLMWQREPVEVHQHSLPDACELAKRLYPELRGLLIIHSDGRQTRHWVR